MRARLRPDPKQRGTDRAPPPRRRPRRSGTPRGSRRSAPAPSRRPTPAGCSVRAAARLASTARPSAPPIMNEVLTTPDARPDSLGAHVAHRGEQHRIERHAGAEAEQQHAGQHVDDEAAVDRRAREQREPDAPRAAARPRAARGCRSASRCFADRPSENAAMIRLAGRNARPDLQRAVAEHELHVERGDEEPREHRRRPQHADDVGGRDVAQAEQRRAASAASRTRASMSEEQREQHRRARRAARASASTSSRPRCR